MLKLLERNIASVSERLIVLAPDTAIPKSLENVTADPQQHVSLLRQVQRLRGRIYLKDGALKPEHLSRDGRHETPEDPKSWHLLVLGDDGEVSGCIWYLEHENPTFDALRIRHAALAHDAQWSEKLRLAVDGDVRRAQRERIRYAEVGGWAVAENSRLTDCLLLILSTYGLSQLLGGAFVAATATLRHGSAAVLRRMGGSRLKGEDYEIPSYFDPNYDCEMELLRFDTRRPSARFTWMVDSIKQRFVALPVFSCNGTNEFIGVNPVLRAPRLEMPVGLRVA